MSLTTNFTQAKQFVDELPKPWSKKALLEATKSVYPAYIYPACGLEINHQCIHDFEMMRIQRDDWGPVKVDLETRKWIIKDILGR